MFTILKEKLFISGYDISYQCVIYDLYYIMYVPLDLYFGGIFYKSILNFSNTFWRLIKIIIYFFSLVLFNIEYHIHILHGIDYSSIPLIQLFMVNCL